MHRRIMSVEAAQAHRPLFTAHRDQYRRHVRALVEEGLTISGVDYSDALARRRKFQRQLDSLLSARIAVLPAANVTAPPTLESTGDPKFQSPWSYAGVPTITIPCGLQFVGPAGGEAALTNASLWCEDRLNFQRKPTLLPPL